MTALASWINQLVGGAFSELYGRLPNNFYDLWRRVVELFLYHCYVILYHIKIVLIFLLDIINNLISKIKSNMLKSKIKS